MPKDSSKDKKSIKKINPSLLKELSQNLMQFGKTSRYEMLKTLPLRELINTKKNSASLQSLTLARLHELGIDGFISAYKGIDNQMLSELNRFISGLLEHEESEKPEYGHFTNFGEEQIDIVKPSGTTLTNNRLFPGQELKEFSLIEATQKIATALEKIKHHPDYKSICEDTLKKFWDKDWPSAPFEESISLKQLCEMNLDNFLKKKSIGPKKISAIVQALEKAVNMLIEEKEESKQETPRIPNRPPAEAPAPLRIEWIYNGKVSIPSYCHSILGFYEIQAQKHLLKNTLLIKLLTQIPKQLSAEQFIMRWLELEHGQQETIKIAKAGEQIYHDLNLSGSKALHELLRNELPHIYATWQLLLSSAAVKADAFYEHYIDYSLDAEFQKAIWQICLHCFQSEAPLVFGSQLKGYLTANKHALELSLQYLLSSFPKHSFQVKRELKILFPLIEQRDLLDLLNQRADLNEETDFWELKKEETSGERTK